MNGSVVRDKSDPDVRFGFSGFDWQIGQNTFFQMLAEKLDQAVANLGERKHKSSWCMIFNLSYPTLGIPYIIYQTITYAVVGDVDHKYVSGRLGHDVIFAILLRRNEFVGAQA